MIQEKGVGALKKMFIDDIDSIELLLAHALPEGLANLAVPVFVFIGHVLRGLEAGAALPLLPCRWAWWPWARCTAPASARWGPTTPPAQKMNNTIVEYINGMEVVKVFNRDGESYQRFETGCAELPGFHPGLVQGLLALDGPLQQHPALRGPVHRCRSAAYLVLTGASTLPDLRAGAVHVLRRGSASAAGA